MVVDLEFAIDPDLEVRHGRRPGARPRPHPGGSSWSSTWRFVLDLTLEVRHGRRPRVRPRPRPGGSAQVLRDDSKSRTTVGHDLPPAGSHVLSCSGSIKSGSRSCSSPGSLPVQADVNSSSPLPIVLRADPGRVPPDHARPSSHFDSELVSIITPSRSAASLPPCWCQASKA
jgi:hypothetical protein